MTTLPSKDIADQLVADGVGAFGGNTEFCINVSKEPDSPDAVITIYDTGGNIDDNPKFLLDFPTIQIRVRGNVQGYEQAYLKQLEIKDKLLGLPQTLLNGTLYTGVWITGDIIVIGYDQSQRPLIVANYRISREPATGDHRVPLS